MKHNILFNHNSGEHLEIDGARIYYEALGDESLPTLLYLHGGLGNMEEFNSCIPELDRAHRVIGIDSRGQGKSTLGSDGLSYEKIQNDVERVLAHLGIETLSIVGFSDGGIVALRLAAFTSLKIEKLVTVGTDWHSKGVGSIREILSGVTAESWQKKFPESYAAYQKLNPEPDFDALVPAVVGMWLNSDSSGYPNEAVKNITCPLLAVRGDDDHLLPLTSVAELCGLVEGARLFNIPFAGHTAFEDQREIFMLGLNEFLRN